MWQMTFHSREEESTKGCLGTRSKYLIWGLRIRCICQIVLWQWHRSSSKSVMRLCSSSSSSGILAMATTLLLSSQIGGRYHFRHLCSSILSLSSFRSPFISVLSCYLDCQGGKWRDNYLDCCQNSRAEEVMEVRVRFGGASIRRSYFFRYLRLLLLLEYNSFTLLKVLAFRQIIEIIILRSLLCLLMSAAAAKSAHYCARKVCHKTNFFLAGRSIIRKTLFAKEELQIEYPPPLLFLLSYFPHYYISRATACLTVSRPKYDALLQQYILIIFSWSCCVHCASIMHSTNHRFVPQLDSSLKLSL